MLFYTLLFIGSLQMPVDQGNNEITSELTKAVIEYKQAYLDPAKLDVSPPEADPQEDPDSSESN